MSAAEKLNLLGKEYEALLEVMQSNFVHFAECAYDLEEVNATAAVRDVDDAFKEFLEEQRLLRASVHALQQLHSSNENDGDEGNMEVDGENTPLVNEYRTLCDEETARLARTEGVEFLQSEHYVEFRQKIWEAKHTGESMPSLDSTGGQNDNSDDELVIATQRVSLVCPLTTMTMSEPVTSGVCKHSFSKHAIMDYIQRKTRSGIVNCPVAGCTQRISVQDLVPNRTLARMIQREGDGGHMSEEEDAYTEVA
ncbi:zinc-finger of the MIZ type in Nse subunit-domain-containing protein [Thamnocephalis sphaerospora]|uniref:Zinc-finger of the MIZ type in Nse subunit-domain-containing protein n=1 Tax=Thamnocephalis sphaerospora TaxID=78915 RepID=A0A4P9XQC0_9FUNG|nr:zinc-finger of the MIZ type in Nse subunit-domain-containing protein [Thamnocephalis sphaerospora]|eukprot:RKP07681.1 zinc-finger of the MIZ type in Nse subunit-domain-containing protein [Thamnocephalis sphaerospora]